MKNYIIIRGPLGIGKSTIAKRLAKSLGGKYFSIDKILEDLELNEVDETLGCISPESFIKANEAVIPKAKKILKSGKIIVFDGNFYHKEQLEHLRKNLSDYRGYIFTLQAPLEVCIERDSKRKDGFGKGAAKAVYNLTTRFDAGTIINTYGQSVEETLEEIKEIIK